MNILVHENIAAKKYFKDFLENLNIKCFQRTLRQL